MAYRNIDTEIWADPKFTDSFTPEDKYFWLFVLTTRYGNISGCFEITYNQIATDMGYSIESVKNLIYRFTTLHKMIVYDETTNELLIFKWYKYNWKKSPKVAASVEKFIDKVKSLSMRKYLTELLGKYMSGDMISISYRYDTVSVSVNNNNNNINTIYEESNTLFNSKEIELDSKRELPREKKKEREKTDIEELFNRFWEAYPRKVGKGNVKKWFEKNKSKIDHDLVTKMISTINLFLNNSEQWQDAQLIPHPTTWLNREGWNDEVIITDKMKRKQAWAAIDDFLKKGEK